MNSSDLSIHTLPSKCLLRLKNKEWLHYNKGKKAVALRWFSPAYKLERIALHDPESMRRLHDLLDGAQPVGLAAAHESLIDSDTDLDPTTLKADEENTEAWQSVFKRLGETEDGLLTTATDRQAPISITSRGPVTIPQTRIRRFYESLRMFCTDDIHKAFAQYLARDKKQCAERLQVLFKESNDHFGRYENIDRSFCESTDRSWHQEWLAGSPRFAGHEAKTLVALLSPARCADLREVDCKLAKLDFRVVDYEVSPLRTEGALFESGKKGKSSGAGGLDLLLQASDGDVPIVAEIKAPGDTNMFLALVQTLTYAVELTTPNQLERLRRSYPVHFRQLPLGAKCDIYIIYFAGHSPRLLKETMRIADKLMADLGCPISRRVRRIAFIQASLPKEKTETKPTFCCTHLAQPA